MKLAYKYILVVIWIALLLSLILPSIKAETESYKIGQNTDLRFTCTLNNAIPIPSTTYNITISYPNGSTFINNQLATADGNGAFDYNVNFIEPGLYKVQMFCYDGTYSYSNEGFYDLSTTGVQLTSAKATSYVIIFVISFLVFLGFLILGLYLPYKNKSDAMTGYIIAVSNVKYLKVLCLCFAFLASMFISYFSWMVCYSYLDMNFVTNIFKTLFYAHLVLILPLFLIGMWFAIMNWIRDSEVETLLSRGLKVR